jgi:hypothetical protein
MIRLRPSWRKAFEFEEAQVEGRGETTEQGRSKFADDGGEFEAVAGAGADDEDLGKMRVPVKKKMFVGGVGVHASDSGTERAGGVGQEAGQQRQGRKTATSSQGFGQAARHHIFTVVLVEGCELEG